MKRHYTILTRTAVMLLAIAAFCGSIDTVKAQESHKKYTLTNGRLYWMDAEDCDLDYLYPVAFDKSKRWAKIHRYGNRHVTHYVKQGQVYLTLDLTDPAYPKVGQKTVSSGTNFDPYCVWTRTGSTGYYYQVHGENRYYLVGTTDTVYIVKKSLSEAIDNATYWYDWDFGAAITNITFRDGVRNETNHWIYYDTVGLTTGRHGAGFWTMCKEDSYQRPEDIIFDTIYGDSRDSLARRYYYSYKDNHNMWHAYGNGALYLPVEQIDVPITITNRTTTVTSSLDDNSLRFGETGNVSLTAAGALSADVRTSYTIYREEYERCGINLNYEQRKTPGFGFSGDSLIRTYYWKNGAKIEEDDPILNPTTKTLTVASVTYSLHPNLRRYLKMYGDNVNKATIHDTTVTTNPLQTFHINCYSIPPSNIAKELRIYVKYSFSEDDVTYYVYDTLTQPITVERYIPHRADLEPTTSPVIYGYVCGGGRMANVGYDDNGTITGGDTKITIHNTDTTYAVYGGNDIAGWVQGSATIQVGTLNTLVPLRLGYIYGGGCGYYSYGEPFDAVKADTVGIANAWADSITRTVGYGQYCFKGKVYPWHYTLQPYDPVNDPVDPNAAYVIADGFDYTPYDGDDFNHGENGQGGNGTVPYIKTAHIDIGVTVGSGEGEASTDAIARAHNDLIQLDTVFGGAENAFIGVDGSLGVTNQAVTLNVNGGTIMALFGGNNYGGSVAQAAHTYITVESTKLAPDAYADDPTTIEAIVNSYYTGYGRDFGIRHLYGGGNMVESAHAQVAIHGGMIDTCFLGGNRASVVQPIGTVDCRGRNFIYKNPVFPFLFAKKHVGNALEDNPAFNASTNPDGYIDLREATTTGNTDGWESVRNAFLRHNPGEYNSDNGRYNIRVLFGGNNKAPMTNLSYVRIRAGSVCYAYGGGNEGDMNNARPWTDDYYKQPTPANAYALNLEDSVNAKFDGWIYAKPRVFGSMINASSASRMIVENMYGGCRKANVEYSSGVALSGGIYGYVQGGCDISGDVGSRHWGEGTWSIIEKNAIVLQDVYGGSDGYYHCHMDGKYLEEDVTDYNLEPYDYYHDYVGLPIPTLNNSNLYIHGGHVLFSAYGGGVMCDVGFKANTSPSLWINGAAQPLVIGLPDGETNGTQKGAIHFQLNGGTIGNPWWHQNANLLDGETNVTAADLRTKRATAAAADLLANNDGNAYGGGYLSSLYGLSYFFINSDDRGTPLDASDDLNPKVYGSVFAGNDCMGSIASFGMYSLPGHTPAEFLASDGTPVNGSSKAMFDAYLRLEGSPRIACVYGSGNGAYDYDGNRPEYSSMEPVCQDNMIDNRPFQSSTLIDIYTSGGFIDTIFGGGNGVGVREDAQILFNTTSKYNYERIGDGTPNDSLFVGTIFGGNNRDDMNNCVPDILLKRGTVKNVYGGGNAGSMKQMEPFKDVCDNDVLKVSTFIRVESDEVHITDNLFGGCRMADVEGMAYIDIRNTDAAGINYVYGGNDISGHVNGNTRIDVSGGYINHIYGGSNGYYDYYRYTDAGGDDSIVVWTLGAAKTNSKTDANLVALNSTGSPYVDDALVNLFGGTIRSNVYGGGRLGDCRNTTVVVNDRSCPAVEDDPKTPDVDETAWRALHIHGAVYGGGEGLSDLSQTHRGNTGQNTTGMATNEGALGSSQVHLHHATELRGATAYGGGRGGDAYETYVYAYDTWDKPFTAIYGGCWGADVIKQAHVILEGVTIPSGSVDTANYTALAVYGGNDFTGNVHAAEIIIHSGTYGNIYGAGNGYAKGAGGETGEDGITDNGEYYAYYATNPSPNTMYGAGLYVPNTEYTTITVNGGRFTGNLYGGGKLGTTCSYKKSGGVYILDGAGKKQVDTVQGFADAYSDPLKYSYIITNIHGGTFDHNIYAGASGKLGGKALVYAFKELNMDGGSTGQSLYGGSANVNDGYYHECYGPDSTATTTLRPSSVINLSGGEIGHSVYGGGYMGVFYGSAYVNVGIEAINKCALWTKTIKSTPNAYAAFKPGATNGYAPALASTNILTIQQSVYGGPNWGKSNGSADFSAHGVYGGETRIFIDGEGYATDNAEDNTLPLMNISEGSIIGAGTSAAGGDVLSRIDLRNYGGLQNCIPTRQLKAIQRADELWLSNTAVEYTGSTDAISAYLSNQITFNRIGKWNNIGYNVIFVDNTIINIGEVNFYNYVAYPYPSAAQLVPLLTDKHNLAECYTANSGCRACTPVSDNNVCEQLSVINPTTKKYTGLMITRGINVDFMTGTNEYSAVNGFAYLMAPTGTNAIVTARPKYDESAGVDDGGFMSSCADSLQALTQSDGPVLTWCKCIRLNDHESYNGITDGNGDIDDDDYTTNDCFHNGVYDAEYPYYNYSTRYRVWSLGNGTRRRFAVVQAHSNHTASSGENKKITLLANTSPDDTLYNLSIAHSKLTLPPTTPGHYYRINVDAGIDLVDEDEELRLTEQAYRPNSWAGLSNTWGVDVPNTKKVYVNDDDDDLLEPAANGALVGLTDDEGHVRTGINAIYNHPNNYFGLLMESGQYFATYTQADVDAGIATDEQIGKLKAPEPFRNSATWTGSTALSGNSYVTSIENFTTALVGSTANASPELDLYMLYDNRFNHTILGTVSLVLDEYEWVPRRNEHGQLIITNPEYNATTNPDVPRYIVINTDPNDGDEGWVDGYDEDDIEMYEHNLGTPINVEISLATILEDFTTMEYEVLAMYNEGRSDIFTRKVVLPATLQTRNLFIDSVTWAPCTTDGEWLDDDTDPPTNFYLTGDYANVIKGAPNGECNRFGMRISTSDNISNNLTSSVGWYSQDMTNPQDLYSMTPYTVANTKKRVTGSDENNYYVDGSSGHEAIYKQVLSTPKKLGVLDGRGEAAINVDLIFDGKRIYPKTGGRGYVGKVILHMRSENIEGEAHTNRFNLVLYVKTRAHGDTIYMANTAANADHITRDGITIYSHKHRGTAITGLSGKEPNDYLHTFQEVFSRPYQEGDVIAILDEVEIPTGTSVFIKGVEHMPIQVIRYSGHHDQFPGEECAYYGPMITVDGTNTSFTTRCIDFNGSMITKTKPHITGGGTLWDGMTQAEWETAHPNLLDDYKVNAQNIAILVEDKYADTLKALGPIIRVKNNGTLVLQNGTTVEHNYNIYDPVGTPDPSLYGAISVTGDGNLQLVNNVTIKENLCKKLTDDSEIHPLNGAIYVDNGRVDLLAGTSNNTAILAYQNLQVTDEGFVFWGLENIVISGVKINPEDANFVNLSKPVHYAFKYDDIFYADDPDDEYIDGTLKDNTHFSPANFFLTRKGTTDNTDSQSDIIYLSSAPKAATKIGISKWFPGLTTRDTIQIVFQATSTKLMEAVYTNKNFLSDDNQYVFYNYGVNTQRVYLQRCATFGYQTGNGTSLLMAESGIYEDSVLDYLPRLDARCPTGGDKVVYRMKGGFYPYTYTWTDALNGGGNELQSRTTPYTTVETNKQIASNNFAGVRLAVADTLFTPAVQMSHTEESKTVTYSVTANDVTGNCRRTKNVTVNLVKDVTGNTVIPFVKTTKADWASTANPGNTALGTRKYEAITIHPRVWADRSQGTIAAQITGSSSTTDSIYTQDADGNHPIEGMSFCEGDVILLSTSPRYTEVDPVTSKPIYTSKFVMWDFSPYYSNPVAFVVPSYSTEVVAYYSPLDYWINAVNTPTLGGVAYDNNYVYGSRPSVTSYTLEEPDDPENPTTTAAGYVTTYHGDVHIYNENGLAWFISVVNGLNGTQARSFYFNNVYLHQKSGGYDMKKHKWTPVGTMQHRFRGEFVGVGSAVASTTHDANPVTIKNIIVDEPDLEYAGFFAFLDSAVVDNIKLQGELVRGSHYVGGLAANSVHSKILNTQVLNSDEPVFDPDPDDDDDESVPNPSLTILTTHHTSGGVLGKSDHDLIDGCDVAVKYVGDAVYNGGIVGYGTSSRISNNGTLNVNRMTSVYSGGAAGYLDGNPYSVPQTKKRRRAKATDDERSYVVNNYVRYDNEGHSQRVGGMVGLAKNTVIENNYVYGLLDGQTTEGGVGAVLDSGAIAMHNYYEESSTSKGVGQYHADATSSHSSQFGGSGNQVTLATRDYGVNNLTRVLNIWVHAHGNEYRTWRSDLEGVNSGFPIFGIPDMIPVRDSLTVTGCDSVEWDGQVYLFDDEVISHVVDSVMMVDSTFTLRVVVNHASREQYADTVNVGDSYSGYGFYLTATEVALLQASMALHGSASIVLNDTLQNERTGCDSIITLTLTVNRLSGIVETPTESQIRVFPNPTTSRVTIESSTTMSHVELYDNEGRRLQDYNTRNRNDITIDVSHFPTGAYYLRVHTGDNVTIQKLIKK